MIIQVDFYISTEVYYAGKKNGFKTTKELYKS
jgi:hypothetical protein